MQGYAHNPPQGLDSLLNAAPYVLLASAASNIQHNVVDFRDRHPDSLSLDAPILSYGRNDSTSWTIFPKAEWIGISGIGEPLIVTKAMIVSQEGVMDSGCDNLFGIEWRVRRFALALFRKPASL